MLLEFFFFRFYRFKRMTDHGGQWWRGIDRFRSVDRRRAAAESAVRVRSSKTAPRRQPVLVPPFLLSFTAHHCTTDGPVCG